MREISHQKIASKNYFEKKKFKDFLFCKRLLLYIVTFKINIIINNSIKTTNYSTNSSPKALSAQHLLAFARRSKISHQWTFWLNLGYLLPSQHSCRGKRGGIEWDKCPPLRFSGTESSVAFVQSWVNAMSSLCWRELIIRPIDKVGRWLLQTNRKFVTRNALHVTPSRVGQARLKGRPEKTKKEAHSWSSLTFRVTNNEVLACRNKNRTRWTLEIEKRRKDGEKIGDEGDCQMFFVEC